MIRARRTDWKEVRKAFSMVNSQLACIIDNLSPGVDFSLFLVDYPFGELPVENGYFYFPEIEGLSASEVEDELGYNQGAMPMGMILDKHFEMHLNLDDYTIIPHGLLKPGHVISTWRPLSSSAHHMPNFLWNVSAGARSLFMLPKVAERKRHLRLKKAYGIQSCIPKRLSDHWFIFKELAQSETFQKPWSAQIIYFGKKWITSMNDPRWVNFKAFLLQLNWNKTGYWRDQFLWDLVYSLIQHKRQLKPNPYIMDTVKYVLNIVAGTMPGFSPADDDNAAPISSLQKIYLEEYGIEYVLAAT